MNYLMRSTIKIVGLLAAVVLVFLISNRQVAAAKDEPTTAPAGTLVLVLFDVSSATATDEIRNRYLNSFDQVLKSLEGGEVLLGERITDNPLATASLAMNVEFPVSKTPQKNVKRLDRLRMNARTTAEGWLKDAKSSPRTDLLGAFQVADKVVNGESYKNFSRKIVVVFSDMVQESANSNFVSDQLTSDTAKKIVDAERAASRLPNLKGVDVWVVGATAATQGGLDPDRINRIQEFWLQYFAETGARIDKGRYAATLMNFSPGNAGGSK